MKATRDADEGRRIWQPHPIPHGATIIGTATHGQTTGPLFQFTSGAYAIGDGKHVRVLPQRDVERALGMHGYRRPAEQPEI